MARPDLNPQDDPGQVCPDGYACANPPCVAERVRRRRALVCGIPSGTRVIVNTGGADYPARAERQTAYNDALAGCLMVTFDNGVSMWMGAEHVRLLDV